MSTFWRKKALVVFNPADKYLVIIDYAYMGHALIRKYVELEVKKIIGLVHTHVWARPKFNFLLNNWIL